jgi:tetratricopeptide (TPR) repeat protein
MSENPEALQIELDSLAQRNEPEALYRAGILSCKLGQFEPALAFLERAAAHAPMLARARAQQATILRQQQRPKEAFPLALQAINADMTLAQGWECAGALLIGNKKWPEAKHLLALAVNAVSDSAVVHAYYSLALGKDGNLDLAYQHAQKALQLQSNLPAAILARIEALCEMGHYDLALRDTNALQHNQHATETANFSFGSLAFINGDYARGMKAMSAVINSGWRGGDIPEWNGEVTDKYVVLYGGQGFGDMLQFARYIEPLSKRIPKRCLVLPRNLTRLFADSFPNLPLAIHEDDANKNDVPMPQQTSVGIPQDADLRCSLPSLANFTEDGFDTMAWLVPYLRAREDLRAAWRKRLAHIPKPWIGIVWAPGTWFTSNPKRVLSYDVLKPLAALAGQHLISLQLGDEAEKAVQDGLFNAAPFISDFADTAALISELDLLISFDSAPAHLAGGLGQPVWTMLQFNTDWRWLVGREDCMWYPAMRLFRQSQPEDWQGMVGEMAVELERFLRGDKSVLQSKPWIGPTPVRNPQALPLPQ